MARDLLQAAIIGTVATYCSNDYAEDWDVALLHTELLTIFPVTSETVALIPEQLSREGLEELLIGEALDFYERKCENYSGGLAMAEEIERDVMLQILDQRWRDHLSDMDGLREGIHLRASSGQDPLVAWQREGFSMFEQLLINVDLDFARFITHVEAVPAEPEVVPMGVPNANEVASGGVTLPQHGMPSPSGKVGRNDPCPCGSKRKYKQCHGRP